MPVYSVTRLPNSAFGLVQQCAGELEGSGKAFFHDSTLGGYSKYMSWNRCLRAWGTHDLETRQHSLSTLVVLHKLLTMESRISGGRKGLWLDIAVLVKRGNFSAPFLSAKFDALPTLPHKLSRIPSFHKWTYTWLTKSIFLCIPGDQSPCLV